MIGQIACNSARASQALPCCFLAPSVWIFEIGIGGKTTFSCLWAINTILVLHRFITYLVKYCSRIHCITKLASIDGASLYYALVMVTGSSIARCTGRKPALSVSGQMLCLARCIVVCWCCWVTTRCSTVTASAAIVSRVTRSCLNQDIEILYCGS